MIYFCADDYGISKESNNRIVNCLENGALNKISVLPNGELADFKKHLSGSCAKISLHINLVEGYSLSKADDIDLLVTDKGCFKYSFIGLFFLSLTNKRKKLEEQLYKEIKNQIDFWRTQIGENSSVSIDSHQHAHMIPLVFKTLMRVIKDEGIEVDYLRIPSEPITPYLFTPSLYFTYTPKGIIKHWLLNFLGILNRREFKKSKIPFAYFMGVMFSGRLTEDKIKKLLPKYIKIAKKHKRDIEIALHPGYLKSDECLIDGVRTGFKKFYLSPWRIEEYNSVINFKF